VLFLEDWILWIDEELWILNETQHSREVSTKHKYQHQMMNVDDVDDEMFLNGHIRP
jgi:hypothetical protein